MQQPLQLWSPVLLIACQNFVYVLLNFPSPYKNLLKRQQRSTKAMPKVVQYTIWKIHTQNTTKLSKAPTTWKYVMGGVKSLGTAKGRSDMSPAEMWTPENSPSIAVSIHTVPEMSIYESKFLICMCCNPYSQPTVLQVLVLITDLLTPHCLKTFLLGMIFADLHFVHVPSFYLQGHLHKNRFIQSCVCDLIIPMAMTCNT